jgi:hypothetical protein
LSLNLNHNKFDQQPCFSKTYVIVENNNSQKDAKSLRKTPRALLLFFFVNLGGFVP